MANYIEKGKSLLENKEYIKAIEFFQASIESLESVKEANLGLAEAYFAINKDEQGKVALFKAMALDPNNSQGISMIQNYCFPSWSGIGTPGFVVQNTQQCQEDPVVNILPHKSLGNNYYVAEQQSGNKLYFKVGAKGCTIVSPTEEDGWKGYKEPAGSMYIPDYFDVNGKNIKIIAIGNGAFLDCESMIEIKLPNELQRIEAEAFEGTSISSIELPTTLQFIEDSAFHLTDLEVITLPNSVKMIGESCFDCHNLCEIQLNEGLLNIGSWAFHFSKIKEVDIPDSVTSIGFNAFPDNTIVRFHGAPPKIGFGNMDNYIVYVKKKNVFLYENKDEWEDVHINTF